MCLETNENAHGTCVLVFAPLLVPEPEPLATLATNAVLAKWSLTKVIFRNSAMRVCPMELRTFLLQTSKTGNEFAIRHCILKMFFHSPQPSSLQ